MKCLAVLALLYGLTEHTAATAATTGESLSSGERHRPVPGAYIVEFSDDADSDSFFDSLSAAGVQAAPRMDLNFSLFKGVSFSIYNHTESETIVASRIAGHSHVKQLWPLRPLSLPKLKPLGTGLAANAWLSKRQAEQNDTWSTHVMTQVDRLRAQNITGKGIRVGVVDSGVDYKHPALGGCFGEGCLVSYGYDFTGDDFGPDSPAVPDADPYDNSFGHGTHVAGILAAQPNEYGFTGAAPDITIGMYKCSGQSGYIEPDILLAAFSRAFEEKSDIISCSAGSVSGWEEEPWAVLASRIVQQGVPVIISAGNAGAGGLFTIGTPSSGVGVTAVASTDNVEVPLLLYESSYTVDNESAKEFGYANGSPSFAMNLTLPLWTPASDSHSEDACVALPSDTPDLSGAMALVQMSSSSDCDASVQATNLAQKNASHILFYNHNNVSFATASVDAHGVKAVGTVPPAQAHAWIEHLDAGDKVLVSIVESTSAEAIVEIATNDVSPGYLSTFSSWGPNWETSGKPQFSAPGGYIMSTYPLDMGGYTVLSGTSMAAPLVSAIYALVAQARGTTNPAELQSVLSTTSKSLPWFDGSEVYEIAAPVAQQGAGQVQAYDAAYATTILSTTGISFNDTDAFEPKHTFTIRNTGDKEITYSLAHQRAATTYHFMPDTGMPASFPNPVVDDWADIAFEQNEVRIPAGKSANITLTGTPPSDVNATLLPVYGGHVSINGSNGDSLVLPYVGVAGSLHDTPILYNQESYLVAFGNSTPAAPNTTFTMPYPENGTTIPYAPGTPAAMFTVNVGTLQLRIDVEALSPDGGDGAEDLPAVTDFFGHGIVGSMADYPFYFAPEGAFSAPFQGVLADGSVVPEGSYRLLVSGLRIRGDASKERDWDIVETVPFTIKYEDPS